MQNLNYNNNRLSIWDQKMLALKIKILKNINSCVSITMSLLWAILIIEFIKLCFSIFAYLH